jgi:hypothetical protein
MAIIVVKNKNGTAERKPPPEYDSWLDFWEKRKGEKATQCHVIRCGGKAEVGGHVIKAEVGSTEYILPICYSCNNKPDGKFFAEEKDLVPANT